MNDKVNRAKELADNLIIKLSEIRDMINNQEDLYLDLDQIILDLQLRLKTTLGEIK
jgi:hypothetical protein